MVSSFGNVIDIKTKTLVKKEYDIYIGAMRDTLVFWRGKNGNVGAYLYLNLLNKSYDIVKQEESKIWEGIVSPNFTKSLIVYNYVIPRKIILCDNHHNYDTIVHDAGNGLCFSEWSVSLGQVPMIWIDDSNFVYAHYNSLPNATVEFKKVNIYSKIVKRIGQIDSIPNKTIDPEFIKDGNGNLLFYCPEVTFQVELERDTIYPITYRQLGNQFEIEIKSVNPGYTIKYNNKIIDKSWCNPYNSRTTDGYFAVDYGDRHIISEYPQEIQLRVWNNITQKWTTFDGSWLIAIIGWTEEE